MIRFDINKCTGCRMCETACSFYHSGAVSRHNSSIKVVNLYTSGIDGVVVCQQCREKYCLECPSQALALGEQGQIVFSPTVCTLCKVCMHNCPIGAIGISNERVVVCDLCGGSPRCVEACSEGALDYIPSKKMGISLKKINERTARLNETERRSFYIKQLGQRIRKSWRR